MAFHLLKYGLTFCATLLFADVLPETKPGSYVEGFERKLSEFFEETPAPKEQMTEARELQMEPPPPPGGGGGGRGGFDLAWPTRLPFLIVNAIWFIFSILAACYVASKLHDKDKMVPFPAHSRRDFPGLFDCSEDSGICLCGYCCGMVQAAHNTWKVGDLGFWCAFLAFGIPYALPSALGWIIYSAVRVYYRTSLRSRASLVPSFCEDFLTVFFCCPCSVCQEALFLKMVEQGGNSGGGWVGHATVGQPVCVPGQPM